MIDANRTPKTHGKVGIESKNGRLRLHLPRSWYGGQNRYLSLLLDDTPENRIIAETKATQITADYKLGQFDPTLERYKPKTHLTLVPASQSKANTIDWLDLWDKYVDSRGNVSPCTLRSTYKPVERKLRNLPSSIDKMDGASVRDYLLKHHTPEMVRRFLLHINACCKWAIKSGFLTVNPYADIVSTVKAAKAAKNGDASKEFVVHPFTREERDLIIAAFEDNRFVPKYANKNCKHSHYAPYVKFLFFTGCRPSEAIGLQWKHIKDDRLLFQQAVVYAGKPVQKTGLKTQNFRYFPINNQLAALLTSIKTDNTKPDDFVFPSPTGKYIDVSNFATRVWKPVLKGLKLEYRNPYQTRHTFITLCLESGIDAKDVAKWVGNSPEIIYKHYASAKQNLEVPEL